MAIEFGQADRRGVLKGTVIGLVLIGLVLIGVLSVGPWAIDRARTQFSGTEPTPTDQVASASESPAEDATEPGVDLEPVAPATEEEPSPTPVATAETTPHVTPTSSATPVPGTTAIFNGGPATGPWQQIGSVSEMRHPEADATAGYAYLNFWADPEEENQSDELWDRLVAEVAPQVLAAGEPLERPFKGAIDSAVAFNSFGGMEDVYREARAFTAAWSAVIIEDDGRAAEHTWMFAVDFDTDEIVGREKLVVYEDDVADYEEASARQVAASRAFADALGLGACEAC